MTCDNEFKVTDETALKMFEANEHDRLILCSLNLACKVALRMANRAIDKEECEGIARLAAVEAVRNWNCLKHQYVPWLIGRVRRAMERHLRGNFVVSMPDRSWRAWWSSNRRHVDYIDLLRQFSQSRRETFMEIAPGIFPCLAEVERMLRDVRDQMAAELFARKYGLRYGPSRYHIHTLGEIAGITRRTCDSVAYSILKCTEHLRLMVDPHIIECPVCHKKVPGSVRKKYCSDKCKVADDINKARIKRHSEPPKFEACSICGTEFRVFKNKRFCKPQCKLEFRRRTYAASKN